MVTKCQAKNDVGVEKVATIFSRLMLDEERFAHSSSQKMTRMERRDGQTGDEIMPTVRENSGAQTATKESEHAEERAIYREQKHISNAFVSMRSAKRNC